MRLAVRTRGRAAGLDPAGGHAGRDGRPRDRAVPTLANATPLAPSSLAALPAQVTPQEAAALRDQGAFVLDVRQASEWVDGHVPGATLIPLDQLPARVSEVPRDRPVVVICRSGNRSAAGRDILLGAGFPAVTSVEGGIRAWESAGLPIKTGL